MRVEVVLTILGTGIVQFFIFLLVQRHIKKIVPQHLFFFLLFLSFGSFSFVFFFTCAPCMRRRPSCRRWPACGSSSARRSAGGRAGCYSTGAEEAYSRQTASSAGAWTRQSASHPQRPAETSRMPPSAQRSPTLARRCAPRHDRGFPRRGIGGRSTWDARGRSRSARRFGIRGGAHR